MGAKKVQLEKEDMGKLCCNLVRHNETGIVILATMAYICHKISRSFFQNAWDIRIRAEICLRKKYCINPILTQKSSAFFAQIKNPAF